MFDDLSGPLPPGYGDDMAEAIPYMIPTPAGVAVDANDEDRAVVLGDLTKPLQPGDRGPQVQALQKALRDRGYVPVGADGVFDFNTAIALRKFQEDAQLPMTGVADNATWRLLTGQGRVGRALAAVKSAASEIFGTSPPSIPIPAPVAAQEAAADEAIERNKQRALVWWGVGLACVGVVAAGTVLYFTWGRQPSDPDLEYP